MASKIFGPRKRRTRQHVIADLAVHHVEGFILEEGHTAERFYRDYGYDLEMITFDERGYVEPNAVLFQIKASEQLNSVQGNCVHDLDIRDYNLWMREQDPVILVLFDVALRQAYWQHVQGYFHADPSRQPAARIKWVRLHIPMSQVVSGQAITVMRDLNAKATTLSGASDESKN